MIVFCRMYHNNPKLYQNERILKLINPPVLKNWDAVKDIVKSNMIDDEVKDFIRVYNDFFSCFAEIYETIYKVIEPEIDNLIKLLKIV
jgi:Holliday junction resolvase RusA-like endonuclease